MELRGEDNKEIEVPSTLGYNPPTKESSSKLSPPHLPQTIAERRRDRNQHQPPLHQNINFNSHQTLDHHYHPHHHSFNQKPRRDSDPNPFPIPSPIASPSALTTPTAPRSNSKTPPSAPQSTVLIAASSVRYRECLKNHAAGKGGHVLDGCGEFMPGGEEGTPEALKCSACECHRNFHRREIEGEASKSLANYYFTYDPSRPSNMTASTPTVPPPTSHFSHHHFSHGTSTGPIAPVMMTFGGGNGVPAESSSEDLNMFHCDIGGEASRKHPESSKKRFRTKFSQEQKEKMMEFAERLGWRIQKHDEQELQQFCNEVGVKRQVFKVWMHNNKQAIKKKQL